MNNSFCFNFALQKLFAVGLNPIWEYTILHAACRVMMHFQNGLQVDLGWQPLG